MPRIFLVWKFKQNRCSETCFWVWRFSSHWR